MDGATHERAPRCFANLVGKDSKVTWKNKSITVFAHDIYRAAATSYVKIKGDNIKYR